MTIRELSNSLVELATKYVEGELDFYIAEDILHDLLTSRMNYGNLAFAAAYQQMTEEERDLVSGFLSHMEEEGGSEWDDDDEITACDICIRNCRPNCIDK